MIEFEEAGVTKIPTHVPKEKGINFFYPESQEIFRRLVETGHVGIFLADTKGYLFYVNLALVRALGYESKDDLLGANLADILFRNRGQREEFLNKLNEMRSVEDYELKVICPDHTEIAVSVTSNLIEEKDGKEIGIEGIVHDVTEKKRLEDDLSTEKNKLEQLLRFDESISAIKEFNDLVDCVLDQTTRILEVEKCSLMFLDDQKRALSIAGSRGLTEKIIAEAEVKLGEMIAGIVAAEGEPLLVRNIEYDRKYQRANRPTYVGRSFMIAPIKLGDRTVGVINVSDRTRKEGSAKAIGMAHEEVFGNIDLRVLCAIAREVSVAFENVKLYKELSSLAVNDPLTDIYNYRQFSKSLDYEIKRCRRSNAPLCIIMIDIDDLKTYNDAFGHGEGSALLKNLGQIIKGQLREVDIICRYAGDEFVIILPDTDMEGAKRAAEKIQDIVGRFAFKRTVTLSLGLAGYSGEMTPHQLTLNADKALDRAKAEGKNRVCVFE